MHTGLVSEHPVALNVLTGATRCRTLQKQNFILRFHHCVQGRSGEPPL